MTMLLPDASSVVWIRPKPTETEKRQDLLIAVICALLAILMSLLSIRVSAYFYYPHPWWVWVLSIFGYTVPLIWRRNAPVPVGIIVTVAAAVAMEMSMPDRVISILCMYIGVYTIGAWERNRRLMRWALIFICVLCAVWNVVDLIVRAQEIADRSGFSRSTFFSQMAALSAIFTIITVLCFGGSIYFGLHSWDSAKTLALLEARTSQLEIERRTDIEQAIAADRLTIARELHDVVAHHISVMSIQAGVAKTLAPKDISAAVDALDIVEKGGQQAIEELHLLLNTLRDPDQTDSLSGVGIEHMQVLLDDSIAGGIHTTLVVIGKPYPLAMTTSAALYRVIQEALTNVRKHGLPKTRAEVRIRYGATCIEVEITDDGAGRITPASSGTARELLNGPGLGLRGMKERMNAVGGVIEAHFRTTGGFFVRATVNRKEEG